MARSQEAQSYLDRVGAALADLPEDERADLLDELGTHVDEIAAEGTSSLEARLGSPEDYAAELRASAGLPPARHSGPHGRGCPGKVGQVRGRQNVAAVERFFVSLRPVWWVARAWIAVAMLTWFAQPHWLRSLAVVPEHVGWPPPRSSCWWLRLWSSAGAGPSHGCSPASGRLLAGAPDSERGRHVRQPGPTTTRTSQPRFVKQPPAEGVYSAGTQVWNIYAYDSAGRMLHDVRLYDQDGKPLSLGLAFDQTKQQTLDAAGQKVDNAFPYRYRRPHDRRGDRPRGRSAVRSTPAPRRTGCIGSADSVDGTARGHTGAQPDRREAVTPLV